ncbi:MAG TPA: SigE family RNA polymerase sigma factor [Nocardioides sp.]|uniref:SigE family RNA polymerase sigma factor n=1 Tax=uncultured Nocardioides sp. TaxID=198441 RepID=UPI000ED206C0|nr:SigE family RNA polymerase sigma factor [uncultured Nocardioides sp.]HCB03122.1 SigE family RNA polymerase sigma factor [Nocardioides sp.]HRI97176.1 SigE family RNA polymerase sigma factor [Nocardioides sp.]HRK46820.1 SigE family RNA polymerase sigma factor [Nocardioides sp.]
MRRSTRDEEFTAYVKGRQHHLLRVARFMCGDQHQAEDMVQNALAKVYTAWPRLSRTDSVDTYVRRVLINSIKDEYRRPWRREHAVAEPVLGASPEGFEFADAEELMQALKALPAGQRRVVVLRHYWGLSVEEVAATLDLPTGTVKSSTSRALAALARALQPQPL